MRTFTTFLISLAVYSAHAAPPVWETELHTPIDWQQIGPYGELLVGCPDSLRGIDPNTGAILWKNSDLAGIPAKALSPLPNSPLYQYSSRGHFQLLDPFSGALVFNSKDYGIDKLVETAYLPAFNSAVLIGKSSAAREATLVFLDLTSGQAQWDLKSDFGRIIGIEAMGPDHLLVATFFELYNIEARTGKILWRGPTTPEAAQLTGKLGGFFKAIAEMAVAEDSVEIDLFRFPQTDAIYIGYGSDDGGTGGYYAYNASSGQRLWEHSLNGYNGKLALTDRGILAIPTPSYSATRIFGGYKINLIDPVTGKGQWGKKGRGLTVKGGMTNYFIEGDTLFVSTLAGKNSLLYLVDITTGSLVHSKPAKLKGQLLATYQTEAGLLCLSSDESNLYDPARGSFVLKKSIETHPTLTSQFDGKIYAYDRGNGEIWSIHTQSGAAKRIGKQKLKFKGGEKPVRLEARSAGLLLSSSQNLALIDYSGNLAYQSHYPAPREPGILRAFYYAQGIRAAIISAQSYYATGVIAGAALTPEFQEADEVSKLLVGGIGATYAQLGQQAQWVASESFKRANARYKATTLANDYAIILAKTGSDNALLRISKDTGEALDQISLGKEKKPVYSLDAVTNQVVLKTGKTKLGSFQF